MDASYQLQESRHTTKGQCAGIQTQGTPQKRHKETNDKARIQEEVAGHRKHRTTTHPMAQRLLCTIQPIEHLTISLHRLHQHTVLHGLCEQTLNKTICITYPAGISAHIRHINAADQHEKRQDTHNGKRQSEVHLQQIDESTQEHRYGTEC